MCVMGKFNDKRVLITGAASGIGRIMGAMALEKGAAALVIWDINQANIDATVAEFKAKGSVFGYRVDISDELQVVSAAQQVKEQIGDIDILINCAGIITSNKTFDRCTTDEINRTININTIAPMVVALQFLPDMIARDSGHICNISSAGGLISNPKMSVYAASKWAVIGWSDSVRIELAQRKSKVRFTTVAPFYINTGMFEGVKSSIFPILKPEYVAKKVIRAIEKNKMFKGIPFGFHFIRFWQFILPTRMFDFFFGKVFGIYHAMDNFTGRKS